MEIIESGIVLMVRDQEFTREIMRKERWRWQFVLNELIRAHEASMRKSDLLLKTYEGNREPAREHQDIGTHLDRIGREQREYDAYIEQHDESDEEDEQQAEDELILESPAAAAERVRQFAIIAELLTAAQLGTS